MAWFPLTTLHKITVGGIIKSSGKVIIPGETAGGESTRRRITAAVLAVAMMLFLGACLGSGRTQDTGGSQAGDTGSSQAGDMGSNQAGMKDMTFRQMRGAAKGTTVTFYGWGGDEKLNRWLDDGFMRAMKGKYGITMERIPMDTGQVLSQLTGKIQAGGKNGGIDMIWINGGNLRSAKGDNVLYDPFIDKLPDFSGCVDGDSEDVVVDFAYPIRRYEASYGKVQLVMVTDLAVAPSVPESAGALRKFMEKCPGRVTYPTLSGFTSSIFARNIIYEIYSHEQFMDMEEDKETVRAAVVPTVEYLRKLSPYLWNRGTTFLDSSATVDSILANGELVMNMTYGAYGVALNIGDDRYANAAAVFQFDKGTIGGTNFMATATSSDNKAGAMMVINEMMSPEIQADRYEKLRVTPVLNNEKLPDEQEAVFGRVDLGKGTIPQNELLSGHLPEMPAQLIPIVEEIWTKEVAGK